MAYDSDGGWVDVKEQGDAFAVVVGTRDVIEVPPALRALVTSHAAAHGFATIADWLAWQLGDCGDSIDEVRAELAAIAKYSPIENALALLWSASRGEFFPWGMDPHPDVKNATEFRRHVKEWAQPSKGDKSGGEVSEEEAKWMRDMADAALELDGKRARELGDKLWRAWGYADFDD